MRRGVLALITMLLAVPAMAARRGGEVGLIKINGAIGPATAGYIERSINIAAERSYDCLIIQLDTPAACLIRPRRSCRPFMPRRCRSWST